MHNNPTYVSLFSSAGLGCFGFKIAGFDCVATAEINKRRLEIQKINEVAKDQNSYFDIDLSDETKLESLYKHVYKQLGFRGVELDFLLATPPCQGMSVANHKKGNELPRNSLVVASIKAVLELNPKAFVFENVRAFLTSQCLDLDGVHKSIDDAIQDNLSGAYVITAKVVNLKDYGSPSSRTRTLVIGTRKDIIGLSPDQIFPSSKKAQPLNSLIGNLKPLSQMNEYDECDFYHSFRSYEPRMMRWIAATPEGKSAFQNSRKLDRPHQVINKSIVENVNKNGDKYRRAYWNDVAPCVHTRNDILASQNTVHPRDNRVFSIRELMLMMGVPASFKWIEQSLKVLNDLPIEEKIAISKKNEMNIRQCLGEGVPTPVFASIAKKYIDLRKQNFLSQFNYSNVDFEMGNPKRKQLAAFYTPPAAAAALVLGISKLMKSKKRVRILEPSAGVGSFLPVLIHEFLDFKSVEITLIELDDEAIKKLKQNIQKLRLPSNFQVHVKKADYLHFEPQERFDFVIGNPPFGKKSSNINLFELFFRKALSESDSVALIVPKVIASANEFHDLRIDISKLSIMRIIDFGESAFRDALIETVAILATKKLDCECVRVISWIQNLSWINRRNYICDDIYPNWLIYRNEYFDELAKEMKLNFFDSYRDRGITRSMRKESGDLQLLRGSNISRGLLTPSGSLNWVNLKDVPASSKFYSGKAGYLAVPNFTYYPRAIPMPSDQVADGSVAVLRPKNTFSLTAQQILFYSSEEFFYFYRVAMNLATRTLNVDKSSVYYWGLASKSLSNRSNIDFVPTSRDIFKASPYG